MSDSLKDFSDKTQESIVQWFRTEKTNCSVSEVDDDCYIDPMLLIIEWNDNELRLIQSFLGCQLVSDHTMNVGGINVSNPSGSIFCVVDFPPMENQQICGDIVAHLRQTYYQANKLHWEECLLQ